MSKPFVEPHSVTPPTAKEEQDTEDLKQVSSSESQLLKSPLSMILSLMLPVKGPSATSMLLPLPLRGNW